VLDDMQEQLERSPGAMRIRRCSVEHPFVTIKAWMGATHFLTKGLECVKTEMSLHVLAYNVKKFMSLLGFAGMMEAIRAYAFLLDLQRVFGAGAVLILASIPKKPALLPEYPKAPHHTYRRIPFHCQGLLLSFYTAWADNSRFPSLALSVA
jgi:hypothetical protein